MSKKTDGFMPLRIQKYLMDTQHLTTELHGAYLLLLMAYWANGGPLPNDPERLRAITKMSKFLFKKGWPILSTFFEADGEFLYQRRAEEELEKARKLTGERIEAGKIGAERRWQSHKQTDGKPMANGMANECLSTSTSNQPMRTILTPVSKFIDQQPIQPLGAASENSDAGASAPPTPIDLKKLVWKTGVDYLTRNGVAEPQARTIIGKWRKHYRDADVLNALAAADAENATNPVAFIQKVLNRSETNDRRSNDFKPSDVFRRTYAAGDDVS